MELQNPNLPANHQDIDNIPAFPEDGENVAFPGRPVKRSVSLVTGGAGFIGSHVAKHLLNAGHRVVVVDDLSGGFRRNVPEGAEFYAYNVSEQFHKLEDLFNHYKFDYVFHLSAYAAEGLSHFIRVYNYRNNLIASTNLINLSVKYDVKRFVFTSSIAVYGAGRNPMSEDMTPMPEDPYGIAKYAVELDLQSAYRMWGLPYTIFRPHNVYGENQNCSDPYRNVIGIFLRQVFNDEPMTIFGDGKQTRAFSHIDDVAPYIARCVTTFGTENKIINIGGEKVYTVLEIAETIKKLTNPDAEIKFLPARKEVTHAYCDHSKFMAIYGHHTEVDLEYGLNRMIEQIRRVGIGEPVKFKNIEVWKNMPESWKKFTE